MAVDDVFAALKRNEMRKFSKDQGRVRTTRTEQCSNMKVIVPAGRVSWRLATLIGAMRSRELVR